MTRKTSGRRGKPTALMLVMVPIDLAAGPRVCLEAGIEHLIAMLDRLDGDSDFEPTGDELEPSLGWPQGWDEALFDQSRFRLSVKRGLEDLETEHDGREPETAEPSLGSDDTAISQIGWGRGGTQDLERDDADLEHTCGTKQPGDDDPVFPAGDFSAGNQKIDETREQLVEMLRRDFSVTYLPRHDYGRRSDRRVAKLKRRVVMPS